MPWCTAQELRDFDKSLADSARYTDTELTAVIAVVEAEIEKALGFACIERTSTDEYHLGDGGSVLRTHYRPIRAVSAVSIDGVTLTSDERAALVVDRVGGRIARYGVWTWNRPVLLTYTHGETAPPADLLFALELVCRGRLNSTRNPVTERASTIAVPGGGTWRPGDASMITGFPEADRIIEKHVLPGIG